MSSTSPVDFGVVVDAFKQTGWPQEHFESKSKLDCKSANFEANCSLSLEGVQWNHEMIEGPDLAHSKTVNVTTRDRNVVTNVTISADAVPGSNINIVSGYLTGISSNTARAKINMPPQLGGHIMHLDLSKEHQRVSMPSKSARELHRAFHGSGEVTVKSRPKVYQGSFTATARFSGDVTFPDGNQVPIELMAREASKKELLPHPFFYNKNALCWKVNGSMDLLLETIHIVE